MANYTSDILKKTFEARKAKDAYLKACRWVGTKIIHDEQVNGLVQCRYVKAYDDTSGMYTVTVIVSAVVDEKAVREEHCKICREVHHSFFINENINCNECKLKAYQRRVDSRLQYLSEHLRGRLSDAKKYNPLDEEDSYLD